MVDDGREQTTARRRVVSTGDLPDVDVVEARMRETHVRYRAVADGRVADYIPALSSASPDWFGIAICGVAGAVRSVGDADREFSIQSVSKPFVFALVCEAVGVEEARTRLGANGTGQPFDSVIAVELDPDKATNPLVNAGAVATTSLVPGADAAERWEAIRTGLSRFAGRELAVDEEVYRSESGSNQRNRGIAHLLAGYDRIYADPEETTDLYTRQCSLLVSAKDLAVMGATLADGGVNPVSGWSVRTSAPGCWPCWPPPACTSAAVTGSTTSGCRARAGSAAGWSRSRRARAAWAPSPRRSTRPGTRCGVDWPPPTWPMRSG